MNWERPPWQVRIRRALNEPPVGAGVLCTDRHVLTCAHVVSTGKDNAEPINPVFVEFQFAQPHRPIPATIVAGGWFPERSGPAGDIAVLALSSPLPAGASSAPLLPSASMIANHRFRAYGYPKGHEVGGVTARGYIVGPAEAEWIQLQADSKIGFSLEPGFSGAPVWDEDQGAVLGIVVTRDRPRGDSGDPRTGYAIPIEVAERYWQQLREWSGWRLTHDPDLTGHWSPRARGVERESRKGWYFTGRHRALLELVQWLEHEPADGRIHVITGGAGSGKSALLARLLTLADPDIRARIAKEDPDQLTERETLPVVGRFSVAIRCTGLDLRTATARIARFFSPTDDPAVLVTELTRRNQITIVLDALDEAVSDSEAVAIAAKLAVPLSQDGAAAGIKVLVGTRRGRRAELIRALGRAAIIDLDDPAYFDLEDLVAYTERCLKADSRNQDKNTYANIPTVARKVSRAIADRAQPSFLVAGLTARTRAEEPVIDTEQPGWEESQNFPEDVGQAMREYVARLPDPDRAMELLIPLAFTRHPGLSFSLWEKVVTSHTGVICSRSELGRFVGNAASYIIEQQLHGGTVVVRLFHQALVDYLQGCAIPELIETTFIEALQLSVQETGGWLHSEDYARRFAAVHALAAGGNKLDELVKDPAFILVADRSTLLLSLHGVKGAEPKRLAVCYRAASHFLEQSPEVNAAYLEFTARAHDMDELAEQFFELGLPQPFSTVLANHELGPDSIILGRFELLSQLAWGMIDGTPILAVASSREGVQIWDLIEMAEMRTLDHRGTLSGLAWGEVNGEPMLAAVDWVGVRLLDPKGRGEIRTLISLGVGTLAVAWGKLDDQIVLAAGKEDGTVWVVDPVADVRLRVLKGHRGPVTTVSWIQVHDMSVLVSSGADGVIRQWDPYDDTPLPNLRGLDHPVTVSVSGKVDGRSVLAMAGHQGIVAVWNPTTGVFPRTFGGGENDIAALALGHVNTGIIVVSGDWDGAVRIWDADTETLISTLVGHDGGKASVAVGQVSSRPVLVTGSEFDSKVRLWHLDEISKTTEFNVDAEGVNAVSWGNVRGTPVLATIGRNQPVRLWNASDRSESSIDLKEQAHSLAWSTVKGKPLLAIGASNGRVTLWDVVSKKAVRTIRSGNKGVWTIASGFRKKRPVIAIDQGSLVEVWDVTNGVLVGSFFSHHQPVSAIAWGRFEHRPVVASGGLDWKIRIWDAVSFEQLLVFDGPGEVTAVAWGEYQGAPVLAAGFDNGAVWLWDVDLGIRLRVFEDHDSLVSAVIWTRLNERDALLTSSLDGTIVITTLSGSNRSVIKCPSAVYSIDLGPGNLIAIGHSAGKAVLRLSDSIAKNPTKHGGRRRRVRLHSEYGALTTQRWYRAGRLTAEEEAKVDLCILGCFVSTRLAGCYTLV